MAHEGSLLVQPSIYITTSLLDYYENAIAA